jgi:potassium-dependent mechanosensitive channel
VTAQEDGERQTFPPLFEATQRYRALADSAVAAERRIGELQDTGFVGAELERAGRQTEELSQMLTTILATEYVSPDRINRVRDRSVGLLDRLGAVRSSLLDRLSELDEMRSRWARSEAFWREWRERRLDDPQFNEYRAEMAAALARIEEVRDRIREAAPEILARQHETEAVMAEVQEVATEAGDLRAGRREALLTRNEPVMFAPGYLAQLRARPWQEWHPREAMHVATYAQFARENALFFLLHLLLALLLGLGAAKLSGSSERIRTRSGPLTRPLAFAAFASTAFFSVLYILPPPLWDVLVWAVLSWSGALIAARLLPNRSLRAMVYLFAAAYPLFLLAEALRMPASLFRLLLAGMAVAAIFVFVDLLRRERDERASPAVRNSVGLGIAMWAVVFVAEVLGFFLLARWILHATVTSAFVVFVVWFMVIAMHSTTETLIALEGRGRWRFVRNVAVPFMESVLKLFRVVLIVSAVLILLDVWEISPSPAETWRNIAGAGFMFAGIHITVGRIITSVVLVYLAFLASSTLRAFVRSEVYPRWELDRGVGDSINALMHYAFVVIAVVAGLGALGVQLQNFAIIAGALGIGIGFGLQNIVNNFVSGLILLFERPVRAGDTVVMDGELGTIKKIGLRSTTVVTFDQSEMIVPNADLVSEKVINWTLSNPTARLLVPVGVAYGTDVTRVLQILSEVAKTHPKVLPDPPPQVLFMGFGDSSLDFEMRVWVEELRLRLQVRSALLAEIDARFREEGIEIPFPQRDLHVRSIDGQLLDSIRGSKIGNAGEGESAT